MSTRLSFSGSAANSGQDEYGTNGDEMRDARLEDIAEEVRRNRQEGKRRSEALLVTSGEPDHQQDDPDEDELTAARCSRYMLYRCYE